MKGPREERPRPLLLSSGPGILCSPHFICRMTSIQKGQVTEERLSPPKSTYRSFAEYGNTKLYNILLARRSNRELRSRGVSFHSLHPGNMISTGIQNHWWLWRFLFAISRPFTKSIGQGAATTVFCAVTPQLGSDKELSGRYWNNCWMCDEAAVARDDQLCDAVWRVSERMLRNAGFE